MWYERQSQAGKLYHAETNTKCCAVDNICVYQDCSQCHYYVTVDGTLYYQEADNSLPIRPKYGYHHDWEQEAAAVSNREFGLGSCLGKRVKSELIKVDQISYVKDIVPTCVGDLILTLDSKLYTIGVISGPESNPKEIVYQRDNVKTIAGSSIMCCYLTWDNKLYIYQDETKPSFEADNITYVCVTFRQYARCDNHMSSRVWYLTLPGRLFCRYFDLVDEIKIPNTLSKNLNIFSSPNAVFLVDLDTQQTYFMEDYDGFDNQEFENIKLSWRVKHYSQTQFKKIVCRARIEWINGKQCLKLLKYFSPDIIICPESGNVTNLFTHGEDVYFTIQ